MMYQNYTELTRISKLIDSYAYLTHPHYTFNPLPDLIHYTESNPSYKDNKTDLENQDRIKKIIEQFKNRSK